MSKPNKVNKTNYDQGGRLTPDEMARERMRQAQVSGHARAKENVIGKGPSRFPERASRPAERSARPAARESTRLRNEREE
jgi:hypothetical protein